MHTIRKILALLLVISTAMSFAACVGEAGDPLDGESANLGGNSSVEESTDDSSEEVTPDGQTAKPVITSVINKDVDTVIVCGTCEEGALISASGFGLVSSVSVNAKGNIFALPITLENSDVTVELTATAEGKTESASVKQSVAKAQGEAGLLAHPIVVSDRFVLFDENSLKVLENNSVNFDTAAKLTESIKSLNVGSGDTDVIYVLAPSRESMMSDSLPEGYEAQDVTLLKQTVKAIKDVKKDNIHVIDLSEAFKNAKDYPLFYDTYSGWTDYAAYIAYTEIMNFIAEEFPDAAPYGMEQFDVNTVEAYLGDLAGYLGLDREAFTETVYDFVPKFDLDIGKEYAVNTQTPPVDPDASSEEDSSAEVSAENASSEESSEEAVESEESVVEEIDEEFLATFSLISDVKLTIGEKDYRFYNTEFKDEFYTEDESYNPILSNAEVKFGTNRTELYLPSALIYRSNNTAPIVPMLAERFRNSVFAKSGFFSIQGTMAKDYAGTPGNTNVDYVIVIITEEDLANLY